MNAPGVLDRYGEPLDPAAEDDNPVDTTTRTRDEIHRDRCAQLRRILRESRNTPNTPTKEK